MRRILYLALVILALGILAVLGGLVQRTGARTGCGAFGAAVVREPRRDCSNSTAHFDPDPHTDGQCRSISHGNLQSDCIADRGRFPD